MNLTVSAVLRIRRQANHVPTEVALLQLSVGDQ